MLFVEREFSCFLVADQWPLRFSGLLNLHISLALQFFVWYYNILTYLLSLICLTWSFNSAFLHVLDALDSFGPIFFLFDYLCVPGQVSVFYIDFISIWPFGKGNDLKSIRNSNLAT